MSAAVAQARLKDAHRMLLTRWERTATDWDDAARAQFQKEFIEPLRQKVHAALSGMARLGEAVGQTRQECQ